jgi:hypothetical protein
MNCCMEHRGGVGYEKNTGDGAGILVGLPDKVPAQDRPTDLGVELPPRGQYGVGNVFLPTDEAERAHCRAGARGGDRRRRPDAARLARAAGASRRSRHRQRRPGRHAVLRTAVHRRRWRRRRGVRTQALPDPQARHPPPARRRKSGAAQAFLHLLAVHQGHRLQRHADPGPGVSVLSGPAGRRLRIAPGHGALAFQHQHLSLVGPRAAEPVHEPQRRDQHGSRQQELDERPPGRGPPTCSATTWKSCSPSSRRTARTPAPSTTCSSSC